MCGIAGICSDSGEISPGLLSDLNRLMRHRGPDDSGAEVPSLAPVVALANCRLAIQDLSPAGHLPMRGPNGDVIAFNGEVFNFKELRRELQSLGSEFVSGSDSEVVLAAYRHWGVSAFSRLRGMFALAIWDARNRSLLLARDRLGVKPLYISHQGGRLVFGSEVRALVASGLVPASLSSRGLQSFLSLGAVVDPDTLVHGISALPAGHWARWSQGNRFDVRAYWTLEEHLGQQSNRADADSAHHVRELLEESVRLRLVSDAPLGVFLSGGLDSSAIAAIAARQSHAKLRTISVVFEEQGYKEAAFQELMARRLGTDHVVASTTFHEMLADLPQAVHDMDQPTMDGINTWIVSRAARRSGLTVALSGLGGDELFGGYPSFRRAPLMSAVRTALPGAAGRLAASAVRAGLHDSDRNRKLAQWLEAVDVDGGPEVLSREVFGPADRTTLVPGSAAGPYRLAHNHRDGIEGFAAVSYSELTLYMRNVLLRDTDVMSMAHSLEVRTPFLDHRLVEYVASLPARIKQHGGGLKPLLRRAVADVLPPEVLNRPKHGFSLPMREWVAGPLQKQVQDVLLDPSCGGQVAAALEPAAVAAVWRRFIAGRGDWVRPWSLFVLKNWAQRWLP